MPSAVGSLLGSLLISTPITLASWLTWDGSKDGNEVTVASMVAGGLLSICNFNTNRSLYLYGDTNAGSGNAVVLTNTGTTIILDTPFTFADSVDALSCVPLDSTHVLVAFSDNSDQYPSVVILNIDSSNNITKDTTTICDTVASNEVFLVKNDTNQCVLFYATDAQVKAVSLSISGTTVTAHTPFVISSPGTFQNPTVSAVALTPTSIFVSYGDNINNIIGGVVLSVISNVVTAPTAAITIVDSAEYINSDFTCTALDSTHIIVSYNSANTVGKAITGTISNTTITLGSPVIFANYGIVIDAIGLSNTGMVTINDTTTMLTYYNKTDMNNYGVVFSLSGTILTVEIPVNITIFGSIIHSVVLIDNTHILAAYYDFNDTEYPYAQILSIV